MNHCPSCHNGKLWKVIEHNAVTTVQCDDCGYKAYLNKKSRKRKKCGSKQLSLRLSSCA